MKINIEFAQDEKDYANAKLLFKEYANSLDFSLSFQNFDKELENIPGKYSKPDGCIILVWDNLDSVGCIGMRPFDNISCDIFFHAPDQKIPDALKDKIKNMKNCEVREYDDAS